MERNQDSTETEAYISWKREDVLGRWVSNNVVYGSKESIRALGTLLEGKIPFHMGGHVIEEKENGKDWKTS